MTLKEYIEYLQRVAVVHGDQLPVARLAHDEGTHWRIKAPVNHVKLVEAGILYTVARPSITVEHPLTFISLE